jgi:non-specific protein-tyrosine kinase
VPEQSEKNKLTGHENHDRTPIADAGQQDVPPRQMPGWISPNYTSSRAVQLSPSVVLANRGIIFEAESATVDAYKMLRTQILQRLQQTNGRTVMITSAVPGEGKTVTAINLAFTFAKEFQQTVLLVDGDLQQQRIHQYLGYESDKGLINYLLDDCPVNDLFTWPGIEKITLISGGRTFGESSEILGAPRMRELIDNMKSRYPERYVFFDVPAIKSGADALVFAPMVDHVLLVVEEGKTSINDIKKSIAMLPEGKLLGLILNRHRQDR